MITVTAVAAAKIDEMLRKRGRGLGIQVGVNTTGCSGLAYTLEYVDVTLSPAEFELFEASGVRVWVAKKSLPYLTGLTMDWRRQGLNEGFEFLNPQEAARCGCGESFSV